MASAQKYERSIPDAELNFGYGIATVGDFAILFGEVLAMGFSLGHYTIKDMYMTGAFSVEGYFKTADWLYVGGIASYEHIGGDVYNKTGTVTNENGEKESQYEFKGKQHFDMVMPMLSIKPFWFNHKKVSMYSKVAGGAFCMFSNSPGSDSSSSSPEFSWAAQITPVGVEFGRTWRGYVELGVGMQGILNFGLCRRF